MSIVSCLDLDIRSEDIIQLGLAYGMSLAIRSTVSRTRSATHTFPESGFGFPVNSIFWWWMEFESSAGYSYIRNLVIRISEFMRWQSLEAWNLFGHVFHHYFG